MLADIFGKPPQPQPISSTPSPGRISTSCKAAVFRVLGIEQVGLIIFIDRRGIGHAAIKPLGIEAVAQIIMEGEILARAFTAVAAQAVGELRKRSSTS